MTTEVKQSQPKISPWIGVMLVIASNIPFMSLFGFPVGSWMNFVSVFLTGLGLLIVFAGMKKDELESSKV